MNLLIQLSQISLEQFLKNLNDILDDVWETMSKKCYFEIFGIEIENSVKNHVCDPVQWKFVVPITTNIRMQICRKIHKGRNNSFYRLWDSGMRHG